MNRHYRIAAAVFLTGLCFSGIQAKGLSREFTLHAELPEFWTLISRGAKLETLATGFGFTEGLCVRQ